MKTIQPSRKKVMLRMATGILAALFVLLGWSVDVPVQPEEFYAAFGTILLVVFLRAVAISGVRLVVRANDYYLQAIGHFFVHRIARAMPGVTLGWERLMVLQNHLYDKISTMRRQHCRRIAVSGAVALIDPTFSHHLFSSRSYLVRNRPVLTTFLLKKHSKGALSNRALCISFNCSTKFPINGLV